MIKYLSPALLFLGIWMILTLSCGSALFPSPITTFAEMASLLAEPESYRHILITLYRGIVGLSLGFIAGIACGIACGFSPTMMNLVSPLVSAMQACPTIVWLSILMVFSGSGSFTPIACVFVAVFPVAFINSSSGVLTLDKRLFVMSHVYRVPMALKIKSLVMPGIQGQLLSAMAYALSVTWKVTSTAEFIGAASGIGSQIFWSFRLLNVPRLFCWALILSGFGALVDMGLVRHLRKELSRQKEDQ